jgi:hypothetical protein
MILLPRDLPSNSRIYPKHLFVKAVFNSHRATTLMNRRIKIRHILSVLEPLKL